MATSRCFSGAVRALTRSSAVTGLCAIRTQVTRQGVLAVRSRSLMSSRIIQDKARFLEALNVEITDEEENGTAPEFTQTIGEFNVVQHTIGNPKTELEGNFGGDTVKISIDLNDCEMLDAEEIYDESDESGPAEPRPMFTIQISNKASETAVFLCMLNPGAALQVSKIGVHTGSGDMGEDCSKVYFSDCSLWDDELAESTYGYLATKGITEEFVAELHDYVFNKEYAEYTNLLNALHGFVSKSA